MEVAPFQAKKRILYVITKSNWGGAQRYVFDLAMAAREAGHEVLVAAGGNGDLIARLEEVGVPVRPIPGFVRDVSLGNEWVAFRALLTLFREWRPEVVHLNSSKAGLSALAARIAGVPTILFTVHGWAWNEARPAWQKAIIAFVYFITIALCHRVIVVSRAARRQGVRLPFARSKMVVIHNGVRPSTFVAREEARATLLPDSTCPLWIGTIAELHPTKGLPVLIEAFEHVLPDFPEAELVIMGEGEERGRLERQIQVEGLYEHAHLPGHIPEAARLLPALDIFVLPSRSEGLAYVLLEAALAERPVVASAVGGIPEIIEHEVTGLLVPYGDRAALTNALTRLAREPELRARLGAALKEKVEQQFSLQQMVTETFAQY